MGRAAITSLAQVFIHESQYPAQVRRDLLKSLRDRQVNHKFHYDSLKQTQRWLALHQAYSPSRTDPDCAATYDRAFADVAGRLAAPCVHLIGLGCGGGQKDTRLLRLLRETGKAVAYTPCDVSVAMVLTARETALQATSDSHCFPVVCDLASVTDLLPLFDRSEFRGAARLVTFFGMLPNFEPDQVLSLLPSLLTSASDHLLISANLAPSESYDLGVRRILPLYDNELTHEWLLTFLLDLGLDRKDGKIRFTIEPDSAGSGLRRVVAYFDFLRPRTIFIEQDSFEFLPGDSIRLFFSFRHTPVILGQLLARQGLRIAAQWITRSAEEGVFLVSKSGRNQDVGRRA
jgi:L-histidine Nalpha-methyltransferase